MCSYLRPVAANRHTAPEPGVGFLACADSPGGELCVTAGGVDLLKAILRGQQFVGWGEGGSGDAKRFLHAGNDEPAQPLAEFLCLLSDLANGLPPGRSDLHRSRGFNRRRNIGEIESNLSWADLAAIPETYATEWTCLFRNLEIVSG